MTKQRGPGGSSPDPEIRDRVLDAFVELVATHGLASTSMSDVAKRAGVSKTTVYTRWPDRRSLVVDGFAHVAAKVPTTDPEGDFVEMLDRQLDLVAGSEVQGPRRQLYSELLTAAGFDERVRSVAYENREEWRRSIEAVIDRGKETGHVPDERDTEVAAEVVMAVLLTRQLQALPLDQPLRDLVKRLITAPAPY